MLMHPSMLANTIEYAAINASFTSSDVTTWLPSKKFSRIAIVGSGPSARVMFNKDIRYDTLVMGNQSFPTNVPPDVLVLTDSSPAVGEKISWMSMDTPVFASTTVDPWIYRHFINTYSFIHTPNHQNDPGLRGVAAYLELMAPKLQTFVIQAGCSLNAAVILAVHLMNRNIIPKVPIHLVGMDFAYESPKVKRIDDYEESGEIIHDHYGRLTSQALLSYAGDLKKIVEAFEPEGFEFYAEPFSERLTDTFVTERSLLWQDPETL